MNQDKEKSKKNKYGNMNFNTKLTASATDCTGLIPAGLNSEAEKEAYEELYPYIPNIDEDKE